MKTKVSFLDPLFCKFGPQSRSVDTSAVVLIVFWHWVACRAAVSTVEKVERRWKN